MAKLNHKPQSVQTHQGAKAKHINAEQQLRRSVMSCLLWEKEFYESGESIADRILALVPQVSPVKVSQIAIEAREKHNLRHVPLLLAACMAKEFRGHTIVSETIERVIQRADELTEILSIHCHINGVPTNNVKSVLSSQMKKGVARAFQKFDEYHLAKYDRPTEIKLRDALFLTHAKPKDKKQSLVFKRLVDGKLKTPDTWEVALSTGGDKKTEFERLLSEGKLGYMALLRNLRNMEQAGVNPDLIKSAIIERKGANRVLPFRFTAAARHTPRFERELDEAMCHVIDSGEKLSGTTLVLVDVSASMVHPLSVKSELSRMDAAATLASMVNGDVRIFTFSAGNIRYWGDVWDGKPVTKEVPPRKGMACIDAIRTSQYRGGTLLGQAVKEMNALPHDRLIVLTDEQSGDPVPDPVAENAYMINVASSRNGVGYGKWKHIDGFSESVLKYIQEIETVID